MLKRGNSPDSLTKKVRRARDKTYLVKQEFVYSRPQKYRFEFQTPALFKKGCLTCGNEHAMVENYGDRHCCKTCQLMLQIPTGELVLLKSEENGRKIKGTAMRNGKPLLNVRVNIDDLRIRGNKVFATFAGEHGEVIVLVKEVVKD